MQIAIIGAGWYGCHIALELKKLGYDVVLYERSHQIFNGISGTFGIRLHAGPHYPRSDGTREHCQSNFLKFIECYPELVNAHEYSIYGMGDIDANGMPSKVTAEKFDSVCLEFQHKSKLKPYEFGYNNLVTAHDIDEPSLTLGIPLRHYFESRLASAGITVIYNSEVDNVFRSGPKTSLLGKQFDYVVNCTSFKSLLPKNADLPKGLNHVYQPCLALVYKDTNPQSELPISFIAMDGFFPCLMPYNDGEKHKYVVTHGKWTILDSCATNNEAEQILSITDGTFVEQNIKPFCEREMERFHPNFSRRFSYQGFKHSVIAKPVTNTEFRSAITFYEKSSKMAHIIPGKVSCIFSAFEEVLSIVKQKKLVTDVKNSNFQYVSDGTLALHHSELNEKIIEPDRNTCHLRTFSFFKHFNKTLLDPSIIKNVLKPSGDSITKPTAKL